MTVIKELKGFLQRTINSVKAKRNIEDKQITLMCIKQTLKANGNPFVTNLAPGPTSLIQDVENILIQMMITMCRIGLSLTSGQGIKLINSLIKDTPQQLQLNEWKRN